MKIGLGQMASQLDTIQAWIDVMDEMEDGVDVFKGNEPLLEGAFERAGCSSVRKNSQGVGKLQFDLSSSA
jgi:hypothetical protein